MHTRHLSRASIALVTVAAGFALVSLQAQQPAAALKDLVPKGMVIGAALNARQFTGPDPVAAEIVARQFSTVSPENVLKWGPVQPAADRWNFEPADKYVAFGQERGLKVIGHCLVWHQQTPASVFEAKPGERADKETLLARMKSHIETLVGRYKGRVHGWDVVNEALDEDGTLRKTRWLEIVGPEFIAKAFEYAHAADPAAELYYNDYNLWKPAKRAGAIRLVKELRAKGLRVDAVGEQGHWGIDEPAIADIDATLGELAAGTGAKVMLTELDVDVLPRDPEMFGADLSKRAKFKESTNIYADGLPAEQQQRLARRYADIFRVVLKHRQVVTRVTFWNVTDAESWLNNFPIPGRVNYPLLWDRQGKPKPAFDAVVEVLRAAR
jgi:endo-1,4-beta-xylanase